MATSIVHRATGIALAVGTILLVWWLLAAATSADAFSVARAFWSSWIGLLLLLGWTWSFSYHLSNGIRHLFWDAGYGYDLKTAYASGYAVAIGSVGSHSPVGVSRPTGSVVAPYTTDTTTVVPGRSALARSMNWAPVMPGIAWSLTTRSMMFSRCKISSPFSPVIVQNRRHSS